MAVVKSVPEGAWHALLWTGDAELVGRVEWDRDWGSRCGRGKGRRHFGRQDGWHLSLAPDAITFFTSWHTFLFSDLHQLKSWHRSEETHLASKKFMGRWGKITCPFPYVFQASWTAHTQAMQAFFDSAAVSEWRERCDGAVIEASLIMEGNYKPGNALFTAYSLGFYTIPTARCVLRQADLPFSGAPPHSQPQYF